MKIEVFVPARAWGIPNPSPFCVKLETWLRMAGLPYVAREGNPLQAPRGKVPYATIDGEWVPDSQGVVEHLAARGHDLDAHLSPADRARLHLLRRTVEEGTYFLSLHHRWLTPGNFPVVREALMGRLGPLAPVVGWVVLRRVRANARAQGVARYTDAQRDRMAEADFDAVAAQLGAGPFLGGDRPCTADAALYGFACQWLWAPFDGALQRRARAHPGFVAYAERVRDRYWPEIPPLLP